MLCVKPATNKEFEQQILSDCKIFGTQPRVLVAEENGKVLGYIALSLEMTTANIIAFSLTDCENYNHPNGNEFEVAEYLIRAAGNYACNRGIVKMKSALNEYSTIFKLLKFSEVDNNFTIHLKVLFKKCENCENQ